MSNSAYYLHIHDGTMAVVDENSPHLLPGGADKYHRITQEEAEAITNPPPTPEQLAEQAKLAVVNKYSRRIDASTYVLACMAAANEARLKSGEWSADQLTDMLSSPEIASITRWISLGVWATARQEIDALSGGIYTDALKAEWISLLD